MVRDVLLVISLKGKRMNVSREELFGELMSEREDVMIKRKNCQTALKALREAVLTLDTLPQYLCDKGGSTGRSSYQDTAGDTANQAPDVFCI